MTGANEQNAAVGDHATRLQLLYEKAEFLRSNNAPLRLHRLPPDRRRIAAGQVSAATQIGVVLSANGAGANGGRLSAGDGLVVSSGAGPLLRGGKGVEMLVIRGSGSSPLEFWYSDGQADSPPIDLTVSPTPYADQPPSYWAMALQLAERFERLHRGDSGADSAVAQAVIEGAALLLKALRQAIAPPQTSDGPARIGCATLYLSARMGDAALRKIDVGEHLAVPVDAVVTTGERRVVFVDAGEDRLVPRDVVVGPRAGEWYAVTSGLAAGDEVVQSGAFLIAAESRLRAAQTYWGATPSGHSGGEGHGE